MQVIATNIAKPRELTWKGKTQVTGIYKYPVDEPMLLKDHRVVGDLIGNKEVHGGEFKAVYLFSSEHYPYWQKKYPALEWHWGMFGENLTTRGLMDHEIEIGNIYKIGTAVVQSTIPREPCYKLGLKFGDQDIIQAFIAHGNPGAYVRILEEGEIQTGSAIELIEPARGSISIQVFFNFLNSREKDQNILSRILKNSYIPDYKKEKLKRFIK